MLEEGRSKEDNEASLFCSHPKDIEEAEDLVEPALTAVFTNSFSGSDDNDQWYMQQQQKKIINFFCAGGYFIVNNGHKVVCGMTCCFCDKPCHYDYCEDGMYGFKIWNSCKKERACNEV